MVTQYWMPEFDTIQKKPLLSGKSNHVEWLIENLKSNECFVNRAIYSVSESISFRSLFLKQL